MSQNIYNMTGVLILQKVTPVIKALFGSRELDETYPGNGQVYIANVAEQTDCSWETVYDSLDVLAKDLKLVGEGVFESIDVVLRMLTGHFNPANMNVIENIIDDTDFDGNATVSALFAIALLLDDGHGLTSCKLESSWYCSKPRLFEFGGAGAFLGTHYSLDESSQDSVSFGESVEVALAEGDLDKASDAIFNKLSATLNGIHDVALRMSVRAKLLKQLNKSAGT